METDHNTITRCFRQGAGALVLGLFMMGASAWAAGTIANTIIKNQASATFKNETGQQFSVTSNMVETLVQQVAGIELVQDQGKRANPGGTVQFPHILTNTGNGEDQFDLTAAEVAAGDDFDFGGGNITFYADLDQDGQPDDLSSPITQTPLLAPDESFAFIAIAAVPGTVTTGETGQFTIDAASTFNNTISVMNTDTVDITSQAIIEVSKSMSATSGAAGSGTYTVTLRYENTSNLTATSVTLLDALPAGMEYVGDSGRWSETGTITLSDNDPADTHTAGSDSIRYCAYDATCTSIPEANQDADTDTTNQVTAIIDEVVAGARGELTFSVNIASGLQASMLTNTGEFEYNDGVSVTSRTPTNSVLFEVTQSAGVVTNGSDTLSTDGVAEPITVASIEQGGTAEFTDYVWNTGNGTDSFDIELSGSTFPPGTGLSLYQGDGFTPLVDTNGNGIPDTGNLDAGSSAAIIIKATLPGTASGDNSGNGYEVSLNATSFTDDTQSNAALNTLDNITGSSVDLTNDAELGSGSELGAGPGPEASPLKTNSTAPGTTTRFTLYLNNSSAIADNYNLAASTDSTFATQSLPADWSVQFLDENNSPISNSGSIAAGTSKRVYADVSVPEGEAAATTSLYFRIVSPITGATDTKHDAVTVTEVEDLVLAPDNQSQVLPGGTVIYTHSLTNQGNTSQTNISLTLADSDAANGWTSQLFEDSDGDGVLSSGDQRISAVATLTPGESRLLFVKVFAPNTVAMGSENLTTLTASWNSGANTMSVEDLTTTNRSDVQILKEQVLDADCAGDETVFSLSNFAAEPGACIMYRLTATNTGTAPMLNVRIQDATPNFTQFYTAGGALPVLSQGSLTTSVSDGGEGVIVGAMGMLNPGESATLIFGVRIE